MPDTAGAASDTTASFGTAPGPGHNLQFISVEDGKIVINPELMREYLIEEAATHEDRKEQLLGSVSRAPEKIADQETSGKMADLVRMLAAAIKNAEGARVDRKEPWRIGAGLVDAVYNPIKTSLETGKTTIERRITVFQREVAEAERLRREAEARRQKEEADRLAAEAAKKEAEAQTEPELDQAIVTTHQAEQAAADAVTLQRAAEAKPAELSRTRSELGAVASLRRFWDFTDFDRETLDLEALRPHLPEDGLKQAIRAFIRAGGRKLNGVTIFENSSTTVR